MCLTDPCELAVLNNYLWNNMSTYYHLLLFSKLVKLSGIGLRLLSEFEASLYNYCFPLPRKNVAVNIKYFRDMFTKDSYTHDKNGIRIFTRTLFSLSLTMMVRTQHVETTNRVAFETTKVASETI